MSWKPAINRRGHALTTFEGVFLSADNAFLEIVGRDLVALHAMTIIDLTSKPDRLPNCDKLASLRRFDEPFEITKSYIKGDGALARVRNHVSSFRDGVGPIRVIASVEALGTSTEEPSESDLLKMALTVQSDVRRRPSWSYKGPWREGAWAIMVALFVLEQQGQPSLLWKLCAAAGLDVSEGYLAILHLMSEDWLLMDRCGDGMDDSSAGLSAKGRAWMVDYLTPLVNL